MSPFEGELVAASAIALGLYLIAAVAGVAAVVFFLRGFFRNKWAYVGWTFWPALICGVAYWYYFSATDRGYHWFMDYVRLYPLVFQGYVGLTGIVQITTRFLPNFIAYGIPVIGVGAAFGLVARWIVRKLARRPPPSEQPKAPLIERVPAVARGLGKPKVVVLAVAAVAAIGYAAWSAWDSGLIPGNPR